MATVQELKKQVAPQQAKPTSINGMLERYKGEIARALPKHMTADRMARIALTECRKTPALLRCKPESLFGAVIQAAQLGLEPGGALGHCYLIPFGQEVQFIVGYRGMIDLARRSGQITSLEAHAVYEGDEFECVFGLQSDLKHVPDWQNPNRADPDKLKFVYAVAKLKDGGVQFEVMSRTEITAIRARSKAGKSGPWVTDYVAMALKTVIRRLFKYLPVSIELSTAVALDERTEADIPQDNWENVIQGESVEVDEPVFEEEKSEKEVRQDGEQSGEISQKVADWLTVIDEITTLAEIGKKAAELRQDKTISQEEREQIEAALRSKQTAIKGAA